MFKKSIRNSKSNITKLFLIKIVLEKLHTIVSIITLIKLLTKAVM